MVIKNSCFASKSGIHKALLSAERDIFRNCILSAEKLDEMSPISSHAREPRRNEARKNSW